MVKRSRKAKRPNSGGSGKGPVLVILGFVLILIIFVTFPRTKVQSRIEKSAAPGAAARDERRPIEILENDSSAAHEEASAQATAAREAVKIEINNLFIAGFSKIPTVEGKVDLSFKIALAAEKQGCGVGDFDLIKGLEEDGSNIHLLLTVEALEGSGDVVQAFPTDSIDFLKKKPLNVVLPLKETPLDYGIFLCLDTAGTGRCKGKPPIIGNEWSNYKNDPKRPDKTLYFQMFTTKGESAYLLPSTRWNAEALKEIEKAGQGYIRSSKTSLNTLALMLTALGSLGASIENDGLSLPFPYMDNDCGR